MKTSAYAVLVLMYTIPGNCYIIQSLKSAIFNIFDTIGCQFTTCCDDFWINNNTTGLVADIEKKLHGQHLVHKTVIGHIKGHLGSPNPLKALVLSFHGPPGVGKNFVSRIIAENLYKDGLQSKFVHLISATNEFPHSDMIPLYMDQLKSWIEGHVSHCERSMFIFDEVDKLPPLLLDVIKPYLEYHVHYKGVNYRKSIFLFLSNSGGSDIGKIMFEHWKDGKTRETLELADVENFVMKAAVNDKHKGLGYSQLINNHLITAFIPFLPLAKEHVRKCIQDAMVIEGYYANIETVPDEKVDQVMKELTFVPEVEQLFSSTGCKRVSQKIDLVMMGERPKKSKSDL
ncbi:unnamed protein product [Lymnaea stagnalis]|uniref:AAA+ ATPase domain-containing protein n=1 Tax=Lymnaea stagnalis TaxID=6523 RepID=A0AAV2HYY9_LYMST